MNNLEMLKVKNIRGEEYLLHPNYEEFAVIEIEGLDMPDVENYYSESFSNDGGNYTGSKMQARNIVIWLVIFGDNVDARRQFFKIFPPKTPVEIYFENNRNSVKTIAYINSVDTIHFTGKERFRVSLSCPDPYLYDMIETTEELEGNPPKCTIMNNGDAEVGFIANIGIEAEQAPDLRRYVSTTPSAEYLRAHFLNFEIREDSESDFYDLAEKSLNIYIDDKYVSPTKYTAEYMTVQDWEGVTTGQHVLQLASTAEVPEGLFFGGKSIDIEVLSIEGETATDLRRYTRTESVTGEGGMIAFYIYDMPDNFNLNTWNRKFKLNGNDFIEGTDFVLTYNAGSKFLKIDTDPVTHHTFVHGDKIDMECFYSESNADLRTKTVSRAIRSFDIVSHADIIIPAVINNYNMSIDKLRVYMGEERVYNYRILWVARADNTSTIGYFVTEEPNILKALTFEVIHSASGQDIREYTDEQIDEGLHLVSNLTITNSTTGESLSFENIAFQDGDKFTVCTIPGEIEIVVTESEWMEPGTSILYGLLKNNEFFKIQPGENEIEISATSNVGLVSGSFSINPKYGGV